MNTACIFIDLKKAFDTIDTILISKLSHYGAHPSPYGVQGSGFNWTENYLLHRKPYVMFKETRSN